MKRNDRDSPSKGKRNHSSRYDDHLRDRSPLERRDRRLLTKSPIERSRGRVRECNDRLLSKNICEEFSRKANRPYYKVLCATIYDDIPSHTIKDALQREYERYGYSSVKISTGQNERVAYIYFKSADDAREAFHAKTRVLICNKSFQIEPIIDVRSQRNKSYSPDYSNHLRTLSPTHSSTSTGSLRRRRPSSVDRSTPFRDAIRGDSREFRNHRREEVKKEKFPNYLQHVPPEQDQKATRTLFVGNLEVTIPESELREIFEAYGVVEDIDVKRPAPGQGNAYAFIKFFNLDMAHRAKVELSGQYIGKFQCKIGYGKATPTTRIWVGGLGSGILLSHLEREFDRFGAIRKIDYVKGSNHAYIQYDSIDAAQAACQEMRGFPLGDQDKRLRVDFADPEPYNFYPSPSFREVDEQFSSPKMRRPPNDDFYWPPGSNYDPLYDRVPPNSSETWNSSDYRWSSRNNQSGNYWDDSKRNASRSDSERRKRPRSPEPREDGYKQSRYSSPDPLKRLSKDSNNSNKGSSNKSVNKSTKARTNGSEPSTKLSSENNTNALIESATSVAELSKCCVVKWSGVIVLKNSSFPCKMHLCHGEEALIESLMREPGTEVPMLRITQRLKLDQPKLTDLQNRIDRAGTKGHCLFLTLPDSQPNSSDATIQTRPLKNLVSYLKQKEAAGVISLPPWKQSDKKEVSAKSVTGVLYAFPPCPFSLELLKRTAPNLNVNNIKDDHLIIVVVRG